MINNIIYLSKKDIKSLLKENTFFLILGVFILMVLISTYIGWSTQNTINNIYTASVQELVNANMPYPDSPIATTSPLSLIKNMLIYVILIGSLLSIVLGHIISVNDKQASVNKIIFSRPITKIQYILSKLFSVSIVLLVISVMSFLISLITISIFYNLNLNIITNLIMFYFISLLYMFGFGFVSIFLGILTTNSAKAILFPLIIWVIITFAIPELGSALYPTSSLNPILPQTQILDSPLLTTIQNIVYPFSISEHYKEIAGNYLQIQSDVVKSSNLVNLVIIGLWTFITTILSLFSVKRLDIFRGDKYE